MNNNNTTIPIINKGWRQSILGYAGVLTFLALSGVAVVFDLWKMLVISWVAFVAMAGAIPFGIRAGHRQDATRLVWGYGLASGAMITSAAVFLVPQAIGFDPKVGGFGVAAGILLGFGSHVVGHRLAHLNPAFDHTAVQLSAHALSAGLIIGLVYGSMPELGLLLGLAIVSHKGPAGYAAARRLSASDRPATVILLPAAGVGLTGIPSALVQLPAQATAMAIVFGFAAGIFLHIAMDFMPRCEVGGEVGEVAEVTAGQHEVLDRLRVHAVVSTLLGGFAVFVAWSFVGA